MLEKIREILSNYKELNLSDEELLNYRYLDEHLDSFAIMQFILEIEETFNITLTPEDTESEEIRTVKGLIDIINKKLQKKH